MKNIETILEENGIAISEEQKTAINKAISENYKTIAEVEKKDAKISTLQEKVQTAEATLKSFEGIDADGMKAQIEELKKSLEQKDVEFAQKMADREFNELLKESITEAKGKNIKAITSLLDLDVLKASSNQKEDVSKALKTLAEAEDSSFLFGVEEAPKKATPPIGSINKTIKTNTLDDYYKGNPYYHPKN